MTTRKKSRFLKQPVEHIDLRKTHGLLDLVQAFRYTSFQSRNVYRCYRVFRMMLQDPSCVIFLGLSGAMIPGGMRRVVRDMIEMNLVDVIVSTGANIFHDVFESLGFRHYIGVENGDDNLLRENRIVRVYDTFMDDDQINRVIRFLSKVPDKLDERTVSSRQYLNALGEELKDEESIVRTAHRYKVPIFVPALADSSIGIGLTCLRTVGKKGSDNIVIDQIRDNFEISQVKRLSAVTGAIYIGGGVPKNYIQQLGPVNELLFKRESAHRYAFQMTTDDPKWGGLSGCTFEEAKSWGKIGRTSAYAQVYMDATIGLPLIVGAIMQEKELYRQRKRRVFQWEGSTLKSIQFR